MKHLVILTGAGISAESGLSTFRDNGGLWQNYDAMELASIQGYRSNRAKVLEFYNARRKNLLTVAPNHAHQVLAELEQEFRVSIITQNVDDLHERAGSTNVLHLHGELAKVTGSLNPNGPECIKEMPLDKPIELGDKAADGSQLRPFIVFFGENVPNMPKAAKIVEEADIFVIIGTSLVVYPAASLVEHVPWDSPCYIIDPGDFNPSTLIGFKQIKTTAVTGVDILKEELMVNQ
ncbi:MAG: NAD-dependent protein deacylase [Muribaculaceae bacterium]|nr:NAD-dependent protein deacylase [Muribaculaceae bacterium]